MITPDMKVSDVPREWAGKDKASLTRLRTATRDFQRRVYNWETKEVEYHGEEPTISELWVMALDPQWRKDMLRTPNFSKKSMAILDRLFDECGLNKPPRVDVSNISGVMGFGS